MTILDKIKFLLLSLITLGIYPVLIFTKKNQQVASELSTASKTTIDIDKLITYLGSSNNIIGTEFTQTKVKVMISDRSLVKLQDIENLKHVSGIFASRGAITILVGNQAKSLAKKLVQN